jgi:nitrate reductase gamma subunit
VLSAAWGYALFAASVLLVTAGTAVFAVFALSHFGNTARLRRAFVFLFAAGAGAYVLSLSALAGYYVRETLEGNMEWRWILFGPSVLAALIVLDYGLYRKLVRNNLPTWRRYHQYISRAQSDPVAMRTTLIDEVILHRSLFRASKVRWMRHALIFWGFIVMFATELIAVVVRDGFPAFGWRDIWREPDNPVRLAFEFVFDVTGLMIVVGCVLALGWRAAVNARPERRYSDTPTTLFLLIVVVTGFVVEGLRIAPTLGDPVHNAAFVGLGVAQMLTRSNLANAALYEPLWLVHVAAACLFIAYVPVMRLIHSCATPLGRLANSQKDMLAAKKRGVLGAMLRKPGIPALSTLHAGAATDESFVSPTGQTEPN